ncbi:methyltransferase, TIGR04325 family [Gammaproteobacteria bacterium]|nr:methyltransferase, TIGR04325 family [Gammaproteobacteria bacterium]
MALLLTKVKEWCPPILLRRFKNVTSRGMKLQGKFSNWEEALSASEGYDSPALLDEVLTATLKVKAGHAAYERDSVTFTENSYVWPTVAAILWAMAKRGGELSVLDYGGALGSAYFQNKPIFGEFQNTNWSVIEQRHFVEVGRASIEDHNLKFYFTIEQCLEFESPNIALFGSVLQYIENPYQIIEDIFDCGIDLVLINRTPFSNESEDVLTVQYSNELKRSESYPSWIFSREKFLCHFSKYYSLVSEVPSPHQLSHNYQIPVTYTGFLFERKND